MKQLTDDWFVSGLIDSEYKRYILLAYLQEIEKEFAALRLYPPFSDLLRHYERLLAFKKGKNELEDAFPKSIQPNPNNPFPFTFNPEIEPDEWMKEVEEIVEYAIPTIQSKLNEGKEIYQLIENQITIEPIGVLPIYRQEGYLLITTERAKEVKAFRYKIQFFENVGVNYFGISLEEKTLFTHTIANPYESMKRTLCKTYTELPVPATYLVYSKMPFPESPTLLPVVKRKFLAYMK